jgi:stalled ribosome rescue protein Dom34
MQKESSHHAPPSPVPLLPLGRQMALWMDGSEAKIFHVLDTRFDESIVHSPNHHIHRHPKDSRSRIHNHPDDEHRFFHEVARALGAADHILLTGPTVTKLLFLRYLQEREPGLEARVVGIETVDHPTDRQLVAHMRQYFHTHLPARGADR